MDKIIFLFRWFRLNRNYIHQGSGFLEFMEQGNQIVYIPPTNNIDYIVQAIAEMWSDKKQFSVTINAARRS